MPAEQATGTSRRIYVVAGMHRAGTSVVARALQALGVDLGPRLMSADVRMNARGFFEDLDLVRIDDALLAACGADWKNIALLDDIEWTAAAFDPHGAEARAFLASRLAANGVYGCKDPRIPRLLPFWQRQFAAADIADHYVIAIRHPLSVIASLTARDGLDVRRSGWLWLTHLVCAMRHTAGRPRVVVDYDQMLAEPARELDRMRAVLGIPSTPDAARAAANFIGDFLSRELRHAEHGAADLAASGLAPALLEAWNLASAMAGATGASASAAAAVQADFDALFNDLKHDSPLLGYAGGLEHAADDIPRLAGELAWARASLAEAAAHVESLRATLAQREVAHAEATTYARDLEATVTRKDADLRDMQAVLDRVRERILGRALLRGIERNR